MENFEEIPEEELVEKPRVGKATLAIMIAVVVITLIAIWLVPTEDETPVEDIPLPGQTTTTPQPVQGKNGTTARAFIQELKSRGGALDTAFEEAGRQQIAGQLEDAYLLYFYAARNGHPEASMVLGEQADPAYYSASTSMLAAADSEQAYKWYSQAAKAGVPSADDRLAALINTIENRANSGDEQAQRLMLQWN